MLASILPTIIVLGALIFVHELGHFLACRLVGVKVEKFSIGFGPELFSFDWQGTRVALSLIPFGGFVRPKGETSEGMEEGVPPEPDTYLAKGNGAKALVISSGVLMNFALAFALFVTVFVSGRPVLLPVIGELMPGYPAATSGLQAGDKVLLVDGRAVADWGSMTMAIFTHGSGPLRLDIERAGVVQKLEIVPKEESVSDGTKREVRIKRIGIKPAKEYRIEKLSLPAAIRAGGESVVGYTVLTYRVLWGLITGEVSMKNIAGPVGIVAITGQTAKEGLMALLQLAAVLSVNLAVINLLPIPALDGGHLFFLAIESITRRRIPQKLQEKVAQVGFVVLMGLMVLVVLNDVNNLGLFEKIAGLFRR